MKQLEIGDKIFETNRWGEIVGVYTVTRITPKRAYVKRHEMEIAIRRESSESGHYHAIGELQKFRIYDEDANGRIMAQDRINKMGLAIANFNQDAAAESEDAQAILALLGKYKIQ